MEDLRQEVGDLRKQLEDRQTESFHEHLDRVRQEAKLEASKTDVNVDLLFQKLILLEEAARKLGHKDTEKYSMLINRFHIHKSKPSFVGSLVLANLCSKMEESILSNERKLMKNWEGDSVRSGATGVRDTKIANANMPGVASQAAPGGFMGSYGGMGFANPFMGYMGVPNSPCLGGMGYLSPPGTSMHPSRHTRPPVRCHNCFKLGHIQRFCPEPKKSDK